MIRSCSGWALMAILALGGGSAHAQGWENVQAQDGSDIVTLRWDSGTALTALCTDGAFNFVFSPVHEVGTGYSTRLRIGQDHWENLHWVAAAQGNHLVAGAPARLARHVIGVDTMELRFVSSEGQSVLYPLDLPVDAEPLQQIMTNCGVSLSDPRDELAIIAEPNWIRRPTGSDLARLYPRHRNQNGESHLLCVVMASGNLKDCEVTFETPQDGGFGAATMELANRFRLHADQAREFEGSLVRIPVRWRIG